MEQALSVTQPFSKLSRKSLRRKKRFIEAYKATQGKVVDSCKIAGIDTKTYYNWFDNLPEFKGEILNAEQEVFDNAYKTIIKASNEGDVSASKFILQRDKRFAQGKVQDNRKIIINYPNWK